MTNFPRAKQFYQSVSLALFDPLALMLRWRGIPYFIRNVRRWRRENDDPAFDISLSDVLYASYDRFESAGSARGHYFHQDLWAARIIYERGTRSHVDVGSRLDGFVAHLLPFCRVRYVDVRSLDAEIEGLEFIQGSILEMPFADCSIESLSCLHVLEHIGLGRYGDEIAPQGYLRAAAELSRVLAGGGQLLIGTPVGRERMCFDAHRVFDPERIVRLFRTLRLREFSFIDDSGTQVIQNASWEDARRCNYGCGLFVFEKVDE
jgi:SAM-dependent methyltransferase